MVHNLLVTLHVNLNFIKMKKILLLIFLLLSINGLAQDSHWKTQPNQKLELNYNLLGRHFTQGAFYGAAGYGAGMFLSGNKTEWGVVGSFLASNLPVLIDGRFKEPETIIGRNLGFITVAASATVSIEFYRQGRPTFRIVPWLRKH
jgi:hypothetical protein